MSEDRRQGDRRQNSVDRRQKERRQVGEKKVISMSLITFITVICVVIVIFITTAAFLVAYYENKLNESSEIPAPVELQYPSSDFDIIDVQEPDSLIDEGEPLITDANVLNENVSSNITD